MDLEPERIADTRCHTGENPLWHPDEEAVYWCDIPNGRLFRWDAATGEYETLLDEHAALGGFTIEDDGALALFRARGQVERFRPTPHGEGDGEDVDMGGEVGDRRTAERETLTPEIPDERATRFNDVIADPEGRVFAGTMPTGDRLGRLYRFDGGEYEAVVDDLAIPNGMGFTLDRDEFYLTSSEHREIRKYDYDRETGELSNRRTFLETDPDLGVPDGMTVDAEGYVWSARWNGGFLARYSPEGEEVGRVEFPARKISSVTFGGPDYETIFVTTAGGDDRENEGDGAGALYRIDAPVEGLPEFRSRLG